MDIESLSALDEEVTRQEWKQTPASIQELMRYLCEDLLNRVAALEEGEVLRLIERDASEHQATYVGGEERRLRCSFCGKLQSESGKLIAGPSVYICSECIALCSEILKDDEEAIDSEGRA